MAQSVYEYLCARVFDYVYESVNSVQQRPDSLLCQHIPRGTACGEIF